MDVSIGEVQARVDSGSPQSATPTEEGGKRKGPTEAAHELRLQQRRAKRMHERLCAM